MLERAEYRCEFVGPSGVRCVERTGIEVDHVEPFGMGGSNEISNLRGLCGPHNRRLAEQYYGEEFIRSAIAHRNAGRG